MKQAIKYIFLMIVGLSVFRLASSQDTLTAEQLQPLTYIFNVENGRLTGEGAAFLQKELAASQFTMLGEYHGSERISEFTKALIPELDDLGYKHMALEVGPISGKILNEMGPNVIDELRKINDKYVIEVQKGRSFTPIPFFSNISDAQFLAETKRKQWTILGIDQEFIFGYQMLMDKIFDNLSPKQQARNKKHYLRATDSLKAYYTKQFTGGPDFSESVKSSVILAKFFTEAIREPKNRPVVEAFQASNHIYWLYSKKQWFENNSQRIQYMKAQLRSQLLGMGFDVSQDKMLIKMGGYHLSKGFSPLRLFEVGNMLNELAEFHGNKALNIGFSSRFYKENGELKDIMDSPKEYNKRLSGLNQMGRQDEWVVIDLRPMVKGHYYYPVKYKFNEHIEDLVKRYDLLVIPKTEIDPTPNYNE